MQIIKYSKKKTRATRNMSVCLTKIQSLKSQHGDTCNTIQQQQQHKIERNGPKRNI
jgi:membrane protein insertase Oxa1/YidC/SpoIIIJ